MARTTGTSRRERLLDQVGGNRCSHGDDQLVWSQLRTDPFGYLRSNQTTGNSPTCVRHWIFVRRERAAREQWQAWRTIIAIATSNVTVTTIAARKSGPVASNELRHAIARSVFAGDNRQIPKMAPDVFGKLLDRIVAQPRLTTTTRFIRLNSCRTAFSPPMPRWPIPRPMSCPCTVRMT